MTHVEHIAAQLRRRHEDLHVLRYEGHVDTNSGFKGADEIGALDKLALGRRKSYNAVESCAPPCMDGNQLIAVFVAKLAWVPPDVEKRTNAAAFQRIDDAFRMSVVR